MTAAITNLFLVIALAFRGVVNGQVSEAPQSPVKTRVIVLGVDHSNQLVSPLNQPGFLAAFIEKARPSAVCIERTPELAARWNFYEFTYEIQAIVLPYLANHPTDICPIDWMPPVEDQKLVFGTDLDAPPEFRPQGGFLTFPDALSLTERFFVGEDPKMVGPVKKRFGEPRARADRDFPRRLFLYRTFSQPQHIRTAARGHPGKTVLVVVAYFHKPDLQSILASDSEIYIVQPSSIGEPTQQEVEAKDLIYWQ